MKRRIGMWIVGLLAGGSAALGGVFAADGAPETAVSADQAIVPALRRKLATRLPDSADAIAVKTHDGTVVLSGTVDAYMKSEIAVEAAKSVRGVKEVTNKLSVVAPSRADDAIARDVRTALRHDPATAGFAVSVGVADGVVTLKGHVETYSARRIIGWVASGVHGVRGLRNTITVETVARSDGEIRAELTRMFANDPLFNDDHLRVTVKDGAVTLAGKVDVALEKTWAREDAWVPGVRRVDTAQLEVEPNIARSSQVIPTPLSDEEIRRDIEKALVFDPRVSTFRLEVVVKDHRAVLRGVVDNLRAARAAVGIARNTGGVRDVVDELRVQDPSRPGDDQILSELRAAWSRSAALANNSIAASVIQGRVELNGTVDSLFEKWCAEDLAERTRGVVEVRNNLVITGPAPANAADYYDFPRPRSFVPWIYSPGRSVAETNHRLADAVRRELNANPFTMLDDIQVSVQRGEATLEGTVKSWAERAAASDAAYQAGARVVQNRLRMAEVP